MCPSKTIKCKIVIGKKYMVKWVNKKSYLAKVLKKGNKENIQRFLAGKSINHMIDEPIVHSSHSLDLKSGKIDAIKNREMFTLDHSMDKPSKHTSQAVEQNDFSKIDASTNFEMINLEQSKDKPIMHSSQVVEQNDLSKIDSTKNSDIFDLIFGIMDEATMHPSQAVENNNLSKTDAPTIYETFNLEHSMDKPSMHTSQAVEHTGLSKVDAPTICETFNLEQSMDKPIVHSRQAVDQNDLNKIDAPENCEIFDLLFHNMDEPIVRSSQAVEQNDFSIIDASTNFEMINLEQSMDKPSMHTSQAVEQNIIGTIVTSNNTEDFVGSESSTSSDCFNSPEYTPYANDKMNLDFETSDSDDLDTVLSPPCSPVNTNINIVNTVAVHQIELDVQRARKCSYNYKKNVKDKRVYCIFCENLQTNFPRHVERKHALETEVRSFILLPKKSKERLRQLELLKNKGNFHYNKTILEKKKGSLIVGRRPTSSEKVAVNDYLPFTKRRNVQSQCAMLLQDTDDFKQLTAEVFIHMKYDNISFTAQNDKLICAFGARLLKNHREQHLKTYISQRMRQISKLLLILRTLVPELKNLEDFLVPQYFKTIVNAAKEISGYNETENSYIHPSIALKLGHTILQCADIIECQSIIQGSSQDKINKIKNFVTVFQKEWKFSISSNACQDLSKKKFNKTINLPDAKDITVLHNYLLNQIKNVTHLVDEQKEINQETYKLFCKTLLTQIILLNRRRSGEVERIQITDYLNRDKKKMQEEILKSLTEVESKLSNSFIRFEIRGKRGRGVPVLLTPDMKKSLDLMLDMRASVHIFEQNKNLFAIPYTAVGVYRGSDCLRSAAIKCGAAQPQLLTSTKLRKHVATITQLLNLTTNDREQLANFMGHDLAIHNEYYRLPDNTLQLSRVSKILLAAESGKINELKGKTLDEFDDIIIPNDLNESSSDEKEDDEKEDDTIENSDLFENHVRMNISETENSITVVAKKSKKRGDYIKWTMAEINAIKRSLGKFIALRKIPQQHDCLLAIKNEPILKNRDWKKIKFQVETVKLY
ncbi:uncharacterized protein LOC132952418 [Metopolophium dirhodum]|uniref:uncharacterized protein LOC132948767 n=1 Tax=Metopolophium dirhodum TaxID=44670 RepID=UPI00298F56EA|nr:uncharacterized protein LOC132948767 [Metopolophium dirhodum]XP_060879126.1 uncharacterized protein LOC132951315 [Metopolophium dirhodum]XP_060880695.1 uncharacterized protein LOC132952418 [Metopolophium dirhodum]